MDDNEKNAAQEPKSDKKLQLDLSEAWVQDTDDDDDIIELKDEIKLPPEPKEAKIDLNDQMAADQPHNALAAEKIIALDALDEEGDDQESVIRLDADLSFEEEEEDETKIPPPVSEQLLKADAAGEVTEITEFDDILPEENNELITLSDIDEESEPEEEEFLELIDVEEDDQMEEGRAPDMDLSTGREGIEDEIIQFEGPSDDVEDVELEDFINDSLGKEIRIDDDFEDDLADALESETESEMDLADPSSDAEEFDFSMEPEEISEKIDRLDTIFFDDSELEAELDDEEESETDEVAESDSGDEPEDDDDNGVLGLELPEEPEANSEHAALLDVSQDQIEKSIERIIQQNFPDKIESMIKEIIEKAVSKEIDRLKNILLEDDSAESG